MHTVSLERTIAADPDAVRAAMAETAAFMEAGGYDEVRVAGDRIHLHNDVGLLSIDLECRLLEETEAAFAYEQVEGIFETMETHFAIEGTDEGTTVTGTTTFALDAAIVGPLLDATVIARQRRIELNGHFDYLEEAVA